MVAEGYKKTDVGVIPNDWDVKAIGKEIDLITGFPFQSNMFVKSGIRLLRGSNVKRGSIDWSEENTKFWEDISFELKQYLLKEGDIVIAMDGSLVGKSFAKITKNDLPALLVQRIARVRSNKIDQGYLKEFICSEYFTKHCDNVKTVSAIPHISPKDIRSYQIPLPPTLAEQTAIATVLSDTDELITSLEKLIAKKKAIKQGAMQELLKPKDGWVSKTLGEVSKFRRGSFPQPYGLEKWYDDNNGFPFIQVYDVDYNMKLKSDTKRHISEEAKAMSVFIAKGSIILTIQGSIGRIAITQYDAYMDRTLLVFESYKTSFNKYFFMLLVHILFEQKKQDAPGGTIKTITKQVLANFYISFPNIEEQNRIAQILSDMDNEIIHLEQKLEKQKLIKQGMMQSLLTGKIRLV